MIPNNLSFEDVLEAMKNCEQTSGMNMIQHGMMVKQKFDQIINCIENNKSFPEEWRIPDFTKDLIPFLLDRKIISEYQIFHDCGKPYCLEIDEEGKRHFPNHSQVSYDTWLKISDNHEIANLIKMDMDIHLLKSDDVEEFSKRKECVTLLLTGIAEVHANAHMFGGFDSISFKIKMKHLIKRGNKIVKYLKGN